MKVLCASILLLALVSPLRLHAQGRGAAGNYTNSQLNAITGLEVAVSAKTAAVTAARTAAAAAAFRIPADPAAITAAVNALASAESELALARAAAFVPLQASPEKLAAAQVATMAAAMGRGGRAGAPASEATNYSDHAGFEMLFDGTMNGWDGAAGVWSVVDGALTADTTVTPGANFLFWKGAPLKDFELRIQAKLTGTSPGSGIMYRSRRNNDTYGNASISGYQFDLGGRNFGQLVDQNLRAIITYPGEGNMLLAGGRHVRIADLGGPLVFDSIKTGEWNQIHIIARGNTLVHIINGKVITLSIDEDPARILEGVFALQAEGMGQIAFKDIWLRRL